jgi:hypothetical protein
MLSKYICSLKLFTAAHLMKKKEVRWKNVIDTASLAVDERRRKKIKSEMETRL